jgi:GPH family glycoside/pentoside/hexuronide:cation symporter
MADSEALQGWVMNGTGLSLREKLSYGLGDLASNLSWNLISGFLLFFYVNVALIPVATAGTLMLVSMVLSALLDPVFGVLVDRTKSRFGKTRPYLLYGAIPLGVVLFLLFQSPMHTVSGKVIYAYVTLILLGLVYASVNIPYGTLLPLMTRNQDEKMQLGSMRAVGSSLGTFMATGLTMPVVALFGSDQARGFSVVVMGFGVLLSISFLVVFFNCKERYTDPFTRQKGQIASAFRNLARNRVWRVTFGFGILILMRLGALISSTIFFCIHVLHQPGWISILLPILSATSLVSAPVAPAFFKRMGIRKGNILLLVVAIALSATLPLVEANRWAFLAIYIVASFLSVGPITTALFAMAANTVDQQQWLFGMRNDGLVYSSISIATKIGMAAGTSLVAYGLAFAHFDALHPDASATGAIRALYYGLPLALMALQVVAIAFYDLDKTHPQIVADLNARSVLAVQLAERDNEARSAELL